MKSCILVLSLLLCIESSLSAHGDGKHSAKVEHVKPSPAVVIGQSTTISQGNGIATPPNSTTPSNITEAPNTTATPSLASLPTDLKTTTGKNDQGTDSEPKNSRPDATDENNKLDKNDQGTDSEPKNSGPDATDENNKLDKNDQGTDSEPKNSRPGATDESNKLGLVEKWLKSDISGYSDAEIMAILRKFKGVAKIRGILDHHGGMTQGQNVTPSTTGQTKTVQTTVSQANGTTPPITTEVSNTTEARKTTEVPNTTEAPPDDPETTTDNEDDKKPPDAGLHKPGTDGSGGKNNPGPKPLSRTPDSSHFAVVFLVMIALLFGLYALYHNRQKIIAVVVEGRSMNGRGGRERYRKLDSESGLEPEARIKNSNEVYVY